MTIPVWRKGRGLQKINEVRICRERAWARKYLASFKAAYANAPFFEDHLAFLEGVFNENFDRLVDLNLTIIRYLMAQLGVSAEIKLLSELKIHAREPLLSVEISKHLGASHFLAQNGAKKYLDPEAFEKAGIKLRFFTPRPPVYPQLWGPFIANLSAFDILFNCGPKSRKILKDP